MQKCPPQDRPNTTHSRQNIQPAEPNAAKPKPNIIPRDSKRLIANVKALALICRSLDGLLVGLETYVEALECGRRHSLESHPSLPSWRRSPILLHTRVGLPQSLSNWRSAEVVKGWGVPIFVELETARNREGLGGPNPCPAGGPDPCPSKI